MAEVTTAASATVLAMGPTTSRFRDSGMMPLLEVRPTVGFIPTTPFRSAGYIT